MYVFSHCWYGIALYFVFLLVTVPEGWLKSLPKADHQWIAQALFKTNAKTGKPELDFSKHYNVILR